MHRARFATEAAEDAARSLVRKAACADSTTNVSEGVREFSRGLRVNKCKAKTGRSLKRSIVEPPPEKPTGIDSPAKDLGTTLEGVGNMKNAAFTAIGILVLLASTAIAAEAQTSGATKLVANIPFEFQVGDKTMPAGKYTVRQINPSLDRPVLQIRSDSGDGSVLVQTNIVRTRASKRPALVFNCYGSQHFFSMAVIDGLTDAWQAPKSRAERGIEKELADLRPQTVRVALTRR